MRTLGLLHDTGMTAQQRQALASAAHNKALAAEKRAQQRANAKRVK